jgi:hypothetical protein
MLAKRSADEASKVSEYPDIGRPWVDLETLGQERVKKLASFDGGECVDCGWWRGAKIQSSATQSNLARIERMRHPPTTQSYS